METPLNGSMSLLNPLQLRWPACRKTSHSKCRAKRAVSETVLTLVRTCWRSSRGFEDRGSGNSSVQISHEAAAREDTLANNLRHLAPGARNICSKDSALLALQPVAIFPGPQAMHKGMTTLLCDLACAQSEHETATSPHALCSNKPAGLPHTLRQTLVPVRTSIGARPSMRTRLGRGALACCRWP